MLLVLHFCRLCLSITYETNIDFVFLNLQVEKISIGYSKKSKRIDAKRLKDTMWEIILKDDTDTSVSLYRRCVANI